MAFTPTARTAACIAGLCSVMVIAGLAQSAALGLGTWKLNVAAIEVQSWTRSQELDCHLQGSRTRCERGDRRRRPGRRQSPLGIHGELRR